ncbi:MAG: pseudouridine synthase [Bacteroidia bacterium]|nr:pseudouridine synthase [Bacteroidia bacterium]HQU99650.1 pseudouridine synthase [Bacteroidia bacterium]
MHHHYFIYKPYGVLSQFKCELPKKKLLGSLYAFAPATMAIGRLDEDSEGLLYLTTDGMVSEKIRSKNVPKEYFVQVDGIITNEALTHLADGVFITINKQQYNTKKCNVYLLESEPVLPKRAKNIRHAKHGPTSWISITLHEGKFRQIRRMTAAVGFPTLRLVRVRIGSFWMPYLDAGQVIEVDQLYY